MLMKQWARYALHRLCHRIRNQLHRRRIADRARHTDWNSD